MDMEEIRDFTDPEFQEVFRTYFTEIGVNLKPDTDIWDEIAASAEKEGEYEIGRASCRERV